MIVKNKKYSPLFQAYLDHHDMAVGDDADVVEYIDWTKRMHNKFQDTVYGECSFDSPKARKAYFDKFHKWLKIRKD